MFTFEYYFYDLLLRLLKLEESQQFLQALELAEDACEKADRELRRALDMGFASSRENQRLEELEEAASSASCSLCRLARHLSDALQQLYINSDGEKLEETKQDMGIMLAVGTDLLKSHTLAVLRNLAPLTALVAQQQ